jgi:hypothetical protein
MIKPLQLMNNDMATLMIATQKIFVNWSDKVSERMENDLITPLQRNWKSYSDDMNIRMKILMLAENEIEKEITQFRKNYCQ